MVNFEEYLASKKIDSNAFRQAEEKRWTSWKEEFEQVHPNSFTVQKLNLINPIRRKYLLKTELKPADQSEGSSELPVNPPAQAAPKPSAAKPVFKPKPKIT